MKAPLFIRQTMLAWLTLWLFIGNSATLAAQEYKVIEWTQLIPQSDLEILLDPPDFMLDIQDGSATDNIDTLSEKSATDKKAARFSEALQSSKVIPEMDGKAIKIPGFVVPLTTNEQREVVSFFIVPYFGACLHLPPPPPNQILFGEWQQGLDIDSLSTPMWFEGTIKVETNTADVGQSAYRLNVATVEPYTG